MGSTLPGIKPICGGEALVTLRVGKIPCVGEGRGRGGRRVEAAHTIM